MCGICGIASFRGTSDADAVVTLVDGMVDALAHRGPDESGLLHAGAAVFGATRLAIRGIHSGRQPGVDPGSGVMVVCNGEIDNHHDLRRWLESRGRAVELATDIGVIPGLYLELGDDFVERLVGVFAIALWDPRGQRLLLARDRAGERSLFFVAADGSARFATEIAALASDRALSLGVDRPAIQGYLRCGCFVAPATPFTEIRKVAPAEVVTIDADGVQRRRYWRWNITGPHQAQRSLDEFDAIFREAVRRQSDVDVEYGAFLSGGVDSSLIAAVARKLRPEYKLKAYTLRFGEPSYDEGDFATRVAGMLGLEAISVWVHPESFRDGISELVGLAGEPLADPAWVPTALLARRAAQDVKLALVGEGGDELFGGYPTYIGARAAEGYARLPGALRSAVELLIRAWPPSDKKVALSFVMKKFVEGAGMEGMARHLLWTSNIAPVLLQRLGVGNAAGQSISRSQEALIDLVQRSDFETTLAEGLLTKADRASMRSALELRAPFLDDAVMEFAATLPVNERVSRWRTKVFLKRYALRYLPGSIVHRRKRGLSVPLATWLRGPLHEWAASRLRSELLQEAGVDIRVALDLLAAHRLRRADHARALWALIVLSEWLTWSAAHSENA